MLSENINAGQDLKSMHTACCPRSMHSCCRSSFQSKTCRKNEKKAKTERSSLHFTVHMVH